MEQERHQISIRSVLIFGSQVQLARWPSSLLGSGDLLDASCSFDLPTVSVSPSWALQTSICDLSQSPLIIGYLPWKDGESPRSPFPFFFFLKELLTHSFTLSFEKSEPAQRLPNQ